MTSELTQPLNTRWLSIFLLFACGIVAAMQFAKIPPVIDQLKSDFLLGDTTVGFIVSLIGFMGIIFSIVVVKPINHFGPKRALLLGLLVGAFCSIFEGMASNIWWLLFLRTLEGFSQLLIVVSAPTLMIFESRESDQTTTMAIWGTFFGVGFAIMSFIAPFIITTLGWRGVFYVHGVAMLILFLASAIYIRSIAPKVKAKYSFGLTSLWTEHQIVYKAPSRLLIALAFLCHTLTFVVLLTFTTRYFQSRLGLSNESVAFWGGLLSLVSIVGTFASGIVLKYLRNSAIGLIVSFGCLSIAAIFVFALGLSESGTIAISLLMLTFAGLVQGFIFSSVPLVSATPEDVVRANGGVSQMGNFGAFLGAPLFAFIVSQLGWTQGAIYVLICCISGICFAWMLGRTIDNEKFNR